MSTALATLNKPLIKVRRRTDATIAKYVAVMERLAKEHGGALPPYKWLNANGYFYAYEVMRENPKAFAHIKTSQDRKYEIYKAQEADKAKGVGEILAPSKAKSLAAYHVPGAQFNPTNLKIVPGVTEGDWMDIGRALASVCQAAYWWVGDWILYGFKTYGKKSTYDLAMQATGYDRSKLFECAHIARKFPPERRCGALTFFHHKVVSSYPPAVADKALAEATELGLTGRQVKELAMEAVGRTKPQRETQRRAITIRVWDTTYTALAKYARNRGSIEHFVAQIVENYVIQRQGESDE